MIRSINTINETLKNGSITVVEKINKILGALAKETPLVSCAAVGLDDEKQPVLIGHYGEPDLLFNDSDTLKLFFRSNKDLLLRPFAAELMSICDAAHEYYFHPVHGKEGIIGFLSFRAKDFCDNDEIHILLNFADMALISLGNVFSGNIFNKKSIADNTATSSVSQYEEKNNSVEPVIEPKRSTSPQMDAESKGWEGLKIAYAKLKKIDALKTDLFAMLIHDLKAPMSEVTANLDILSYTVMDDNLEYVRWARKACDQVYRMVSDLLDVIRIEEGKLKLILTDLNAVDIMKEAVYGLRALSITKNINIEITVPELPIFVRADENILMRIIQNVLVNAIQYSGENDVLTAGVDIDVKESGEKRARFFVIDNGPGIPHEYLDTVFNKFFQVEAQKSGEKITTGLGLTFCSLAAKAHGGDISVVNNKVKGCTFSVYIPETKE